MGKDGRFDVAVTFDERRGYVGTAPELRSPVIALSLGGLRRKVEALMLPDEVIVMLSLDRAARLERDRRRLAGRPRPGFARMLQPRWTVGLGHFIGYRFDVARCIVAGTAGLGVSNPWQRKSTISQEK